MKLQFIVLLMKGKDARGPQVALDHLHVVVARHELDVHGAGNVEGFGDLGRGALHLRLRSAT